MMTTRALRLRQLQLGGGAPVRLQSMCNTLTSDAKATSAQIQQLAEAGCEIIRVAVPDFDAVHALPQIIEASPIPVIADIHFDYRLALGAMEAGVDGLRINPGNIGDEAAVRAVAEHALRHECVIRVGANSGSVKRSLIESYMQQFNSHEVAMAEALVDSTLEQCARLEKYGFKQIKVSLKSSDVLSTFRACQRFAERADYPQHIGVTEAGTLYRGIIKSSVGIGALLLNGIGDTIRVSLTADPIEEIRAGIAILESTGCRKPQVEIVSCPTCGRTQVNLQYLAEKVDQVVAEMLAQKFELAVNKIAVMGCAVNGPGEARNAELAMCGAKSGQVMICSLGKPLGIWTESEALEIFKKMLKDGVENVAL